MARQTSVSPHMLQCCSATFCCTPLLKQSQGRVSWPVVCFITIMLTLCCNGLAFDPTRDPWETASLHAQWSTRTAESAIAINGHAIIAGGAGPNGQLLNDVWRATASGDDWGLVLQGVNHSKVAPWKPRKGHQLTVIEGTSTVWLTGGYAGGAHYLNDVWITNDLSNWFSATGPLGAAWSERTGHMAVWFAGKVWVMGGALGQTYNNEVWYSTNGSTWTQAADALWSARTEANAAVFNGDLFVAGGRGVGSVGVDSIHQPSSTSWHASQQSTGGRTVVTPAPGRGGTKLYSKLVNDGYFNDVWKTSDGHTWEAVTSAAQWAARSKFGLLPFSGHLWVLGGLFRQTESTADTFGDLWKSTDGATWLQATEDAVFLNRSALGFVDVGGSALVFGGLLELTDAPSISMRYLNDVWRSTPALLCQSKGLVCGRHGGCRNATCRCSFGFAGPQCRVPICVATACMHGHCASGPGAFSNYPTTPLPKVDLKHDRKLQPLLATVFEEVVSASHATPNQLAISPSHCSCDSYWTGYNCTTAVCFAGCDQGTCVNAPNQCICNHGYYGELCNMHNSLHAIGKWVKERALPLYVAVASVCFGMVATTSLYTNYWKRRQAAVLRARARSSGRRVRFAHDSP